MKINHVTTLIHEKNKIKLNSFKEKQPKMQITKQKNLPNRNNKFNNPKGPFF
jgi:hypothetical protein